MPDADFKLVVILCEPELAVRLAAEIQALGARGFCRYDGYSEWRRGRGPGDAPGPHDWQGTHTRIETVVRGEIARAILDRLAQAYFEHFAVFAYVVDATIARRERYV